DGIIVIFTNLSFVTYTCLCISKRITYTYINSFFNTFKIYKWLLLLLLLLLGGIWGGYFINFNYYYSIIFSTWKM
ncbi:MAG: hypothetical protein N7Q72_06025, partial [Spiroplasma sp. Tabriz.8]|nr:hypothetical protein [Spiroplasma sp. Tabriz.8]